MTIHRTLEKSLNRWKEISGLDFALIAPDGKEYVNTGSRKLPSSQNLEEFLSQTAISKASGNLHYFKIYQQEELSCLLLVWGKGVSSHTIGELADRKSVV